MTKTASARYILEFKQKAVRLIEAGQSIATVARTFGVVEQTLLVDVNYPDRSATSSLTRGATLA